MCVNKIHINTLLARQKNKEHILRFRLELVKMGGRDFSHPCDGRRNIHLVLCGP